jgi:O-antigen ligase/Flp pilus assembly protein TadD
LGNPDYLAGYLVALLPLSLILTLRSSGQRAWIGFRAITILLFAGLLMTRVRGSLLALALALVVLVVGLLMPWSRELADKNRKTLLIAFAILILVGGVYSFHELFGSFLLRWVFRDRVYPLAFGIALIVLIVGILIPWGNGLAGKNKKTLLIAFSILVAGGVAFWSRYGGMNTFDLGQASVQQRLQTYKIGMEMVKAHPWTGIGLGQLGRDFPLYQWRPYTEAEWPAHPLTLTEHMHNEYLQFAAEGGLIGLGLFLLVLFAFFRHALKLMDNPAIPSSSKELMLGIAASMTALLGQALTNFPFQVIPTGVLLGFFLAAPLCLEPRPAEPPVTRQENRVLLVVLGLVLLVLGAWGAGNMAASIAFRDTVGETNLGNAANAEKYASRLAVLAPGDPKAWDAVAKARELNKQGDKALEAYDKEISLNPNAVQAYYAMAQEQLLPGHVDEALCTCQKCLSLVPNYSPVLWLEGVCYFKLNRYAEAAGDFEKYVPYAPGEESLYVNLGVCYVKSGRKADAITAWEKAHSLNPNDAQVVLYLKSVGVKI